jgi:hypothetical protein
VSAGARPPLYKRADPFPQENVYTPHQPTTGPTRTGLISTGRFQPYGTSRARRNEHRNAEAGPSTLVPPPAPHVGPLTPQPSGGISETTADAERRNTNTEEDKAPVSDFYCSRIPRVSEGSSSVRRPRRPGFHAAKGGHVPPG